MKLWDKGIKLDEEIEKFMTGDDPILDQKLIPYDCIGSVAHAKMLHKIGILTKEECEQIVQRLHQIIELNEQGKFLIQFEDEDVHTAIENDLTRNLGDLGKKLHTARSRNDQILLDMRLYIRDKIVHLVEEILTVCNILCNFAEENKEIPIPGRTHFQHAMPSSLGLWAGAFAESLVDDLEILKGTYDLINQCPLGSAASYGVSLPIDRTFCSNLLGFRCVQNNVLYANNSRGKFEAAVLHSLVQIMNDLSKIAADLIFFSAPEFGYVTLPEKFCPGSSLMPQKRNPCPLELIRAKSATVQAYLFQTLEIIRGLSSGYHRDFQETKRPVIHGFEITVHSIQVFGRIFSEIQVNRKACLKPFTKDLFATDEVLRLAKEGIPFRDAYKQIARNLKSVAVADPIENILSKTHIGATGNLGLHLSRQKVEEYQRWVEGNKMFI